jgi:hypothetical protein
LKKERGEKASIFLGSKEKKLHFSFFSKFSRFSFVLEAKLPVFFFPAFKKMGASKKNGDVKKKWGRFAHSFF